MRKHAPPTLPSPAVRAPDPGIVARLGAAADGALRAGSPGHLSEMCRLKSPSPACRRLVLGLVVALGLRCAATILSLCHRRFQDRMAFHLGGGGVVAKVVVLCVVADYSRPCRHQDHALTRLIDQFRVMFSRNVCPTLTPICGACCLCTPPSPQRRWRRWSDIRSRLLGNKSELVGVLKR